MLASAYKDFPMIGHGLKVISQRLSQPEGMVGVYEELSALYEPLSEDFQEFYPVLWQYAQAGLGASKTPQWAYLPNRLGFSVA